MFSRLIKVSSQMFCSCFSHTFYHGMCSYVIDIVNFPFFNIINNLNNCTLLLYNYCSWKASLGRLNKVCKYVCYFARERRGSWWKKVKVRSNPGSCKTSIHYFFPAKNKGWRVERNNNLYKYSSDFYYISSLVFSEVGKMSALLATFVRFAIF